MEDNRSRLITSKLQGKDESQPLFKILHSSDVKVRETKSDLRLYYFDEDVDIVVVTGSKSHIEPAHLHSENTEIYFVIQGRMVLNVEGEALWLQQGDLVTVKPGACHYFETFDEKVIFLAIKKEPGLDDKELC